MKKKLILLMMIFVLACTVFSGCGSKGGKEEHTVTGVFMDKKDFMFTVKDKTGTYLGFNFDETPENYDDLDDGDIVTVTYTGVITEVDPFEGEIIKIEKVK
jgi:hypothetical protein